MNSKSAINDVQTILKLVNDSEALSKNQTSKTNVLIVVNEITSIIFSDDASSSTDNVLEGFYFYYN